MMWLNIKITILKVKFINFLSYKSSKFFLVNLFELGKLVCAITSRIITIVNLIIRYVKLRRTIFFLYIISLKQKKIF